MGPESPTVFNQEDQRPDPDTVAAAGNIIGPPPVATPEQLAAAQEAIRALGVLEAAPQKPAAPLYDPSVDESNRPVNIQVIENVQKPL